MRPGPRMRERRRRARRPAPPSCPRTGLRQFQTQGCRLQTLAESSRELHHFSHSRIDPNNSPMSRTWQKTLVAWRRIARKGYPLSLTSDRRRAHQLCEVGLAGASPGPPACPRHEGDALQRNLVAMKWGRDPCRPKCGIDRCHFLDKEFWTRRRAGILSPAQRSSARNRRLRGSVSLDILCRAT